MSWIAKNDITGTTYGKVFDSIYDCQRFIDTDLVVLQYEWKRICALEKEILNEEDYKKWYADKYGKSNQNGLALDIFSRIEYAIFHFADNYSRSQNVIRCWYVEQNRFAEGMDF